MNTAICGIFMSVTLQAAVHLGREYLLNSRSVKNQSSKSVDQLFRTTEKLIKEQTEITGLSTINWDQPMWRESSLLCDRAVRIMKSRTYVFSDSVLCLGGIGTAPVPGLNSSDFFLVQRCLFACRKLNSLAIDGVCRPIHQPPAVFSHAQS